VKRCAIVPANPIPSGIPLKGKFIKPKERNYSMIVTYEDFEKVDIRVGKILKVEDFPRAKKPSYKVQVDFGPDIGMKWSSVGAKSEYRIEEMTGRLVVGVVNFSPKNIAGFMSEVLILGAPAEDGGLSLLQPSRSAKLGGKVY
jgi:tRNA-binding protein